MVLNGLELTTEAKSYLQELSRATGQVVFLGTEQEGQVVYIDKCVPYNDHRNYCALGTRKDFYCTSLGKSLLMDYNDQDIRNLYADKEMKALTEHTITDIESLISEVHLSRDRQYAVDNEEDTIGSFCVSAPIYDYRGKIIAAISTSWLLNTRDDSDKEKNIKLVIKTAADISKSMGFLNRVSNSDCQRCYSHNS
jgi:DNA-binding IclR family transcriptional regulator